MIEVLVSLLIFSFGLLGMAGMLARSLTISIDAEDRNRAALLANEIASTMWLKNSISVDTTAWQTRVKDMTNGGLPDEVRVDDADLKLHNRWIAPLPNRAEAVAFQATCFPRP